MAHSPENFRHFHEEWLRRQRLLLNQLLDLANSNTPISEHEEQKQQQHKVLIDQVLCHCGQYFEAKSNAAREDVCQIFSPPWLNPLEKSFLWISDSRPSLAFQLVSVSVSDLSPEQMERMEAMKEETVRDERMLCDEIASVQESAGGPPWVDVATRVGRLVDGEVFDLMRAVEEYKEAVLVVAHRADLLRRSTVIKVVDILSPAQTVKFLAAVAKFQLDLRR
ncbi:hypothetical protein Ancab_028768 [Ancistrocladus abbreviatus]